MSPAQRPKPRPSAVDQIVAHIYASLRAGRLSPGARLVEAELTEELGVSRSSLREALRRLAASGVVEIIHHRGARIRRYTRKELLDNQVIREALEGLAARKAAEVVAGRPADQAKLRAQLARLDQALAEGRYADFTQDEQALNRMIVELSGDARVLTLIEQLNQPALRAMFAVLVDVDRLRAVLDEYAVIVDAVTHGRADEAETAMRRHVRGSTVMFERTPTGYIGADGG